MADRFVRNSLPLGESTECPCCRQPIMGGETAVYGRRSIGVFIVTATACSVDCCRDALDTASDREELITFRGSFEEAAQ